MWITDHAEGRAKLLPTLHMVDGLYILIIIVHICNSGMGSIRFDQLQSNCNSL